jgi:hypothetical protein
LDGSFRHRDGKIGRSGYEILWISFDRLPPPQAPREPIVRQFSAAKTD